MDQLVVAAANKDVKVFLRRTLLHCRAQPCKIETQLLDEEALTMVATAAAPAVAMDNGHSDVTAMNREPWSNSILDAHERALGFGLNEYAQYHQNSSHMTRSPERAPVEPDHTFQSPHQHLGGPCHGTGNSSYHNALENSPFSDLANDPVAASDLAHKEIHEEEEQDEQPGDLRPAPVTDEQELKPAAGNISAAKSQYAATADPFVGATIKLSYSDDRAFDDENQHQSYNDYPMHSIGDMNMLAHHTMHDSMPMHGYPILPWRPEYPSPVRSHSLYPPPPPRPYPLEYRLGGGDRYAYTPPIDDIRQASSRETPLGALPAPANAKRAAGKQRAAALKKKNASKKPRVDEAAAGPPVAQRLPSLEEVQEAKTPRARAALTVWYERLTDLVAYKQIHGDCNVPQKYLPNQQLGIWTNKQRMEKKFMDEGQKTSMTWAKLQALDAIGFTWAKRKGQPSWDTRYAQLKEYQDKHGHCRVPTKYQENPALGRWVSTQRSQYKQFIEKQPTHMTEERKRLLEEIGFKWNAMERGEGEMD